MQNHKNGAVSTFLVSPSRTIAPAPTISPDLNPLDHGMWDKLAHQVNWDAVPSKTTLISELEPVVGKASADVVFESCSSWSDRLYELSQGKESFLNNKKMYFCRVSKDDSFRKRT